MKNKLALIIVAFLVGCSGQTEQKTTPTQPGKQINVPEFSADSAYYYIEKQLSFGPRVPNTSSHRETGDYLVNKFRTFGASVREQEFEAYAYDGELLNLRNIIASFNPNKNKRVMLSAHWDSRQFADKDEERPDEPIPGANDGASGVAVLLEIGRLLGQQSTDVGIDIILFDGEDNAEPVGYTGTFPRGQSETYWCLGSQYWSRNKHESGYFAYYGILLDMVGAKNAQFHQEGISRRNAGKVVKKVWDTAHELGFGDYFIYKARGPITDDHVFVNEYAKIPMINIVHYDPEYGYFGDFHHTHKDNLDLIGKETLKAVGQTVTHVIYYE